MGALLMLIIMLLTMGVIYPIVGVIIAKLTGSKKTIAQILNEL